MNHAVMITWALTGDDTKIKNSPHCPVTPDQIANSAIDGAAAGARFDRRSGPRRRRAGAVA